MHRCTTHLRFSGVCTTGADRSSGLVTGHWSLALCVRSVGARRSGHSRAWQPCVHYRTIAHWGSPSSTGSIVAGEVIRERSGHAFEARGARGRAAVRFSSQVHAHSQYPHVSSFRPFLGIFFDKLAFSNRYLWGVCPLFSGILFWA